MFDLLAVPVADIHDDDIKLLVGALVALVTGVLAMMSLLIKTLANSRIAANEAKAANAAVNNTGPGEHRLYDRVEIMGGKVEHIETNVDHLVEVNKIFQARGYDGMDEDLSTGPALQETIRDIQKTDRNVGKRLSDIYSTLIDHIEREEKQTERFQTMLSDHIEREDGKKNEE
jgi:hypothetical protein